MRCAQSLIVIVPATEIDAAVPAVTAVARDREIIDEDVLHLVLAREVAAVIQETAEAPETGMCETPKIVLLRPNADLHLLVADLLPHEDAVPLAAHRCKLAECN